MGLGSRVLGYLFGVYLILFSSCALSDFTPDADFTDNQDGTVTHKLTGLTWKRCSEGQAWTGSTCDGVAEAYPSIANINTSFAGHTDWRVPSPWELASIVDYDISYPGPAINLTAFPQTPSATYWSNKTVFASTGYIPQPLDIDFHDGSHQGGSIPIVRLVRGGLVNPTLTTPTTDFIDNMDGTVTHKLTGLTWMRCTLGKIWSGSECTGVSNRYSEPPTSNTLSLDTAAQGVDYAGHSDWRVPTIQELVSIVEYEYSNRFINNQIFPGTGYGQYWSSTAYSGVSGSAWCTRFDDGVIKSNATSNEGYVRLVRGLQRPTPNAGNLENPVLNTTESGIGVVSGWHCSASQIQIFIDGVDYGFVVPGTNRFDTEPVCGHHKTGFARLINWNVYTPGEHTISVYADGRLFETRTFNTTMSAGVPFATGLAKSFTLNDFPSPGHSVTLTWNESRQSFVVTDHQE